MFLCRQNLMHRKNRKKKKVAFEELHGVDDDELYGVANAELHRVLMLE